MRNRTSGSCRGTAGPTPFRRSPSRAGNLLDGVGKSFDLEPGHFQETVREPSVSIVAYRDGTKAAVYSARGVGWTYAADIEGRKAPANVSMLGWPGPFAQYHAANAFEHWIVEMMLTRK